MDNFNDFQITFATVDDHTWVDCVDPHLFDGELKPEFLVPYLQDANHWLVLAWYDDRVIGKCSAVVHLRPDQPRELYIDEIDVAPAFRKRGVAKAMMAHILKRTDDLGIPECWVGTEQDNVAARALYQAMDAEPEEFVLYYLKG